MSMKVKQLEAIVSLLVPQIKQKKQIFTRFLWRKWLGDYCVKIFQQKSENGTLSVPQSYLLSDY